MSIELIPLLLTAVALGVGSSAHCLGMCGGITCALGLQNTPRPVLSLALYNTGRITAYATLALIAGSALQQATLHYPNIIPWIRSIAALLLLALALHTLQWWRGILIIETAGQWLWQPIRLIASRLLKQPLPLQPLFIGFMWGWLPCALVYSTLSWAVTQTTGWQAALLMLAFGVGTLPAMFIGGLSAKKLSTALQSRTWRITMALLLIACAGWTLVAAWSHAKHTGHHGTHHQESAHSHKHH